jgi:hypothetical protein
MRLRLAEVTGLHFDWVRDTPLVFLGAALLFLMTVAFVGGRFIHEYQERRRKAEKVRKWSHDYEGYIVSSVLGLLAILLGFTFSLAINRYEQRRELVIAHANAVGTTYLRAQLLGPPHRERLSKLLVGYTDNLVALGSARRGDTSALLAKDDATLTDIWAATAAAFDSIRSSALSISLLQTTNDMIDLDTSRRNLRIIHIPTEVFGVLLIYLIGAAGVLGYVLAEGPGRFAGGFILILLSLSLLLIIDIDRPASGVIREDQTPMLLLRDSLKKQPPAVFDRWRTP